MFTALTDRFDAIFKRLRSKGKLTDSDIDEIAREIRIALLEADVNVTVVKSFIARVKERASSEQVHKALSPAQQVIKIVQEELVVTLGSDATKLAMNPKPPTVVMMVGLQGSGKTTNAAKLARLLQKDGQQPMLVAADLQRPAAVEQLRVLGKQLSVPVYSDSQDPVSVAHNGVEEAKRLGRNVVIVDTAGRLQIDEALMAQLQQVCEAINPTNVVLVVDAMTGQDAVNVAAEFHEQIGTTGILLTKIDGDARGGAALSVKEVTGTPILYVGTGEKLEDLEPFYPDRMAERILGMGDVLTLIEKAEEQFDEEAARKAEAALRKGDFTLEDFLEQMQKLRKMGPLQNIVAMLPGVPKELRNADVDEGELGKVEAIIHSMTREERNKPKIINGSRRIRIANGSGTRPADVNQLLKQFEQMRKMLRQLGGKKRRKGMPFQFPG